MREPRRVRILGGAAALTLMVLACGSAVQTPMPTPSPSPPFETAPTFCPTPGATPIGDTAADHTIAGIFVEGSLHFSMGDEDWAARADVVLATLDSIGPSSVVFGDRWTSTQITIDNRQSLRGSMPVGSLTLVVSGDLNDCNYQRRADRLQPGQEYLFILGLPSPQTQTREYWIEAAWPAGPDGIVTTIGGPMTLAELKARLDEIPLPSGFAYPTTPFTPPAS